MSTPKVRQLQEVELTREHWVNGQRFDPGTILSLPATCASNLVEIGAARARDTETKPTDND